MNTPKHDMKWFLNVKFMMTFAVLMGVPGFAFGSDLAGHVPDHDRSATTQKQEGHQLDKGHRLIEGVIQEVNENTIRVDAGEAGEIAPRYLNLSNSKGKGDFKIGDMVQIEVNAQNKVVNFQLLHKDGARH
ncbi:MAG TPA: hypothetical protein VLA60_15065 [Nitrospirales bacterium]|nr:hypothetical protein [Nitrospirales bacterium]